MPSIKGGCNRYKTKKERIKILAQLRDALEYLLEKGLYVFKLNWTFAKRVFS